MSWNPEDTSPEGQTRGISGPTKRTYVLQKKKKEKEWRELDIVVTGILEKVCETILTFDMFISYFFNSFFFFFFFLGPTKVHKEYHQIISLKDIFSLQPSARCNRTRCEQDPVYLPQPI